LALKAGLARSGATISSGLVPFTLLSTPISFTRAEALDQQPGKDIGHLVPP
jgi:hypothetical protein